MQFTLSFVAAVAALSQVVSATPLAARADGAIKIIAPSSIASWFQGAPNTISWSATEGAPDVFNVVIRSEVQTQAQAVSLAAGISTAAESYRLANVTQAPAHYWVIDFVDPATNKIIAESETFSILPPDSVSIHF